MQKGKKIPAKVWKEFLKILSEKSSSVTAACEMLGIERRSYYYERSRNPKFGEQVDRIFDQIRTPHAEDALFALINEKNLGAIKFYLSQRGGERWNQTRIVPFEVRERLRYHQGEQIEQRLPTPEEKKRARLYEKALRLEGEELDGPVVIKFEKGGIDLKSLDEYLRNKDNS